MLVLTRRKNESILIADNIRVTIVEVRGDRVRLGIDLPADVPIHREEVYEALQRHTEQATSARRRERAPDVLDEFHG